MNGPLRIAMFLGTFPVVSETFILRQITGLIDLGHEVDIYADLRGDGIVHPEVERYDLLARTMFMDMPAASSPYEMPVRPLTGRTWPPGSETSVHNFARVLRAIPKLATAFARAPRLARQVLDRREYGYQAGSLSAAHRLARLCSVKKWPAVLHAHFGPVGNSFRFARQLFDAPLVVSFHGYDFSTVPRREGPDVYKRLFQTADAITVNTEFTRRELEKLGCPPGKIVKLPVGLNPDEFVFRERRRKADEPVRLLTVARLVEVKGLEYALRAVAQLRRRFPEVQYDLAGDGPLRAKLQDQIAELDLAGSVRLHGALPSDRVKALMDQAHIFILPSATTDGQEEGQGLVVQEAQACGIPVLVTRHGALPEGLQDGMTGLIVAERDAEALADGVARLVERAEDWPRMGCAGRRFVQENYDIRKLNEQLVRVYRQAMQGK